MGRRFIEVLVAKGWPSASLRAYLVGAVLIATLPIAALIGWQVFASGAQQRQRLGDELRRSASALAESVDREIDASVDALAILSRTESIRRGDVAAFRRELTRLPPRPLRPAWSGVHLLDAGGAVRFDTAPNAGTIGTRSACSATPATLGAVVITRSDSAWGLGAANIDLTIASDDGRLYCLGATIAAPAWQALLQDAALPADGFAGIFDNKHEPIAQRVMASRAAAPPPLPKEAVGAARWPPDGTPRAGEARAPPSDLAWQTLPLGGFNVGVGVPSSPLDAAVRRAFVTALGTAIVCLVIGVGLALLIAECICGPLGRLVRDGAASTDERIAVREIAALRTTLQQAAIRDGLARRRLETQADEFETLFASCPIALAFAQDPDCRVVLHNARMDALAGPATDWRSEHVVVLRAGQPIDPSQMPLQRAAAAGVAEAGIELTLLFDGRPPRAVIAGASPLLDAAGRPRAAIGAFIDITERKEAEARLHRADERLRESQRLIDLAQDAGRVGFFRYQFDQDRLTWTPGQAKLFGFERAPLESTRKTWLERIHADDRAHVEDSLHRLFAEHSEQATIEYRTLAAEDADEQPHWLSSRLLIRYDAAGRPLHLIGASVDVSDQKRDEQDRVLQAEREHAARREAEAANRAKDEFLAMLAHELRNPLGAIASASEVLKRMQPIAANDEQTNARPTSAAVAEQARAVIERQTRHLARLMDDLLDASRVISGKVSLARQPVDLKVMVEQLLSTMALTGASGSHVVDCELAPVWIHADAARIEQVASNLITNALKYTPSGGHLRLRLMREPGSDCGAGDAVFEVEDDGSGIAPQLLPRIFEMFVQGERTLERRAGGLGIGLTLVRRLVELHDGSVAVHSAGVGQGSRFSVRLPAIDPPESHAASSSSAGAAGSHHRDVVLIEDNDDARLVLAALLELDGHDVHTHTDGLSGLRGLLERQPDAAIVDIGLPGLSGFEVARRSRAAGYTGTMIAVSGYGQVPDVNEALRAGFDAHLVKPVDVQRLRELL